MASLLELPRKAEPLLSSKARYRVLYGGRGSAKSWTLAGLLIISAVSGPVRVLCTREYQNSIDESAKYLLERRIEEMGLSREFRILRTTIKAKRTGAQFLFWGLRHNVKSIQSLEAIDICWVEEAQTISRTSWDVLVPTVRKTGSHFFVSFNPELEIDETWQRFILRPPSDSLVIEMNWRDNPWFPKELDAERLDCAERDPVGYKTIWEGQCRQAVEGSIYGDVLEKARVDGRVTRVPHDEALPVYTCWDLGVLDATAIWFFQVTLGGEIHWIDYHEDNGPGIGHYARIVKERPYSYRSHYAPHDVKGRELGTGGVGMAQNVKQVALGFGLILLPVKRLDPKDSREDEAGIAVVRDAFGRMWFDELRCKVGLQMLSRYRRGFNRALEEFRPVPIHDGASHCADAMRCGMVGHVPERAVTQYPEGLMPVGPSAWMT